jgi:hypothetical protein
VTFQKLVIFKELRDVYRLFRIFRLLKSRRLRLARHVPGMGTGDRCIRNFDPLEKCPVGKLRRRKKNDIFSLLPLS